MIFSSLMRGKSADSDSSATGAPHSRRSKLREKEKLEKAQAKEERKRHKRLSKQFENIQHSRGNGKVGPPPPRGTLNEEKLAYLDWRLCVLKASMPSEDMFRQHVDDRISFELATCIRQEINNSSSSNSNESTESNSSHSSHPRILDYKQRSGQEALRHARISDNIMSDVPHLAIDDSMNASDDSHSGSGHSDDHANSGRRTRPVSFLFREQFDVTKVRPFVNLPIKEKDEDLRLSSNDTSVRKRRRVSSLWSLVSRPRLGSSAEPVPTVNSVNQRGCQARSPRKGALAPPSDQGTSKRFSLIDLGVKTKRYSLLALNAAGGNVSDMDYIDSMAGRRLSSIPAAAS
ncbi:hypothetical protein IE53DRAFT_144156 [Violaceomyces palustris]|uniref:Uncharacterized protein n=1 Tax=Violaceomyces palustris TaxID=1673888 RepID=A0ACD0NUM4_9BASI|nr:hypothetical protein IE53DRAFT_144156 [Violaceomyces palustris]